MKTSEQMAKTMYDRWQKAMLRFRKPKPFYELEDHERKTWIAAAKATGCEDSGQGHTYHHTNVEAKTHADFMAAESKGTFFGKHINPLVFEKLKGEQK